MFFGLADIAAKRSRGGNAPLISPLALKAVKRIDAHFDGKCGIKSAPAEYRLAMDRELNPPVLTDLKAWMQAEPRPCRPPHLAAPEADRVIELLVAPHGTASLNPAFRNTNT